MGFANSYPSFFVFLVLFRRRVRFFYGFELFQDYLPVFYYSIGKFGAFQLHDVLVSKGMVQLKEFLVFHRMFF